MIPPGAFPRLTPSNHRVTSPSSRAYNCIAWAAGDVTGWWEPGELWPADWAPPRYSLANLVRAYEVLERFACG